MLLIIFFIQLAIGIYAFMQIDKSDGNIQPLIKDTMTKAYEHYNNDKETREAFNFVQQEFKCCGVNGPTDYILKWHNGTVPASCCKVFDGTPCQMATALIGGISYFEEGCVTVVSQTIAEKAQIVFYICIGVAAVEVCVLNQLKKLAL